MRRPKTVPPRTSSLHVMLTAGEATLLDDLARRQQTTIAHVVRGALARAFRESVAVEAEAAR